MESDLREMLDHHRIRRTLAEYCHGCDRSDELLMASIYHADSWDDHGHLKARGADFVTQMTADIRARTSSLWHLLGQSLIEIDGDEAGAETYFHAAFLTAGAEPGGKPLCNQLGGRFVDRLVREGGRWLVVHRVVVRDWSLTQPVDQDEIASEGLTPGARSSADPASAVLGLVHRGPAPAMGLRSA